MSETERNNHDSAHEDGQISFLEGICLSVELDLTSPRRLRKYVFTSFNRRIEGLITPGRLTGVAGSEQRKL